MELHKVEIRLENLELLKKFIGENRSESFRYFESRPFECIEAHISTVLYYEGDRCVGYGHLDLEGKVWLGIIVDGSIRGKGYGSVIMDDLISRSNEDIYLTVDRSNISAKNLYSRKGFEVLEEKESHYLMVRKNK